MPTKRVDVSSSNKLISGDFAQEGSELSSECPWLLTELTAHTRTLLAMATLMMVLAGVVLRLHFFLPDLVRSPDEGTYMRQTNVLLEAGISGLRALGAVWTHNPTLAGMQPTPSRIGFLAVLAGMMRITHDRTALAGAELSLMCSVLSLGLTALFAWRFLSPFCAPLAALFYAVLPFDLVVARRAWQDAYIGLIAIAILMLVTWLEQVKPRWRNLLLGLLALGGVIACTTKENVAIFFALCAGGVCLRLWAQRRRTEARVVAGIAIGAAAVAVAIDAWIFGGLGNFLILQRVAERASSMDLYDRLYDSGPAWMFAAALFRTSPLLTLGALCGAIVAAYRGVRMRSLWAAGLPIGIALLTFAMLMVQVVTQRYNFRYSSVVYAALCLLASIGLAAAMRVAWRGLAPLGRPVAFAVLGFAIAVAALRDVNFAKDVFLNTGMQDLALRPVLGVPAAQLVDTDVNQ